MVDIAFDALITVAIAGVAAIWLIVAVIFWAPSARRRGGTWTLEAVALLAGPGLYLSYYLAEVTGSSAWSGVSRVITVSATALAVVAIFTGLRHTRRYAGVLISLVIVYYATLIASGLGGAAFSLPEVYLTTPIIVLAFALNTHLDRQWLLGSILTAMRLIVAASLIAAITPAAAFNTAEARTIFGIGRLEGITPHPNTLAFLGVAAVALELARRQRNFIWLAAEVAAILLAQSNTAWIAVAVMLLFQAGRFWNAYRIVASVGAAVLAVALVVSGPVGSWAAGLISGESTLNGRTRIWEAALHGFHQYPIFGYGPTLLDDQYQATYLGAVGAAGQAHNQWVQTLGTAGIVGLIGLIALLVGLAVAGVRGLRRGDSLAMMLLAAEVVRMVSETPLRPVGPEPLTLVLAATIAAAVYAIRPHAVPAVWRPPRRSSVAEDLEQHRGSVAR